MEEPRKISKGETKLIQFLNSVTMDVPKPEAEAEVKETIADLLTSEFTPRDLTNWIARGNSLLIASEKLKPAEKKISGNFLYSLQALFLPFYAKGEENVSEYFFEAFNQMTCPEIKQALAFIGIAFHEDFAKCEYHESEVEMFIRLLAKLMQINKIYQDYEAAEDKNKWIEANFSSL